MYLADFTDETGKGQASVGNGKSHRNQSVRPIPADDEFLNRVIDDLQKVRLPGAAAAGGLKARRGNVSQG